ncbi:MAG: hypothetical protein ACR2IV_12555 [Bryobacteraceae bacterium]
MKIEFLREGNADKNLGNCRDYNNGIEALRALRPAPKPHGTTHHIRR